MTTLAVTDEAIPHGRPRAKTHSPALRPLESPMLTVGSPVVSQDEGRVPAQVPQQDIGAIDPELRGQVNSTGHLVHDGTFRLVAQDGHEAGASQGIVGDDENPNLVHSRAPGWRSLVHLMVYPGQGYPAGCLPSYGSSCSVLLSAAVRAMWEKAVSGVAPCQCFSSGGM